MPLSGDPDAVEDACRQLGVVAQAVGTCGESVEGHGRAITADWSGLAAPLALARTQQDGANVRRVAEAVTGSVGSLGRYAEELRAAQQDHARGESMAAQGRVAISALESAAAPAADAGRERASQAMDDGTAVMRAAEERARVANEAAARALDAVSSSLSGIAPPATPPAAAPTTSSLAELGNVAASLGNAALEHPSGLVAALTGGGLVVASATGLLAGAAVSLTGGGAMIGVPGAAVSTAGVATGVVTAGAGLLDLATHAATDSAVTPFQVNQKNSSKDLPDNPTGNTIREATTQGRQDHVREAPDDEAVRALAGELMEGKERYRRGDHPGTWVRAEDGSQIGFREDSGSGGPTIDVTFPNKDYWKVHRPLR